MISVCPGTGRDAPGDAVLGLTTAAGGVAVAGAEAAPGPANGAGGATGGTGPLGTKCRLLPPSPGPPRAEMGRLGRALKPPRAIYVGSRRTLRGPGYRPEEDFDPDIFPIILPNLSHLIESLMTTSLHRLFKGLILTLDNDLAHRTLTLFVAGDAGCKRHMEKQERGGNLQPLGQVDQCLTCLASQRSGVNHAETIQGKTLLHKEMHQGEGFQVVALVAVVITNTGVAPNPRKLSEWGESAVRQMWISRKPQGRKVRRSRA